MKHKNQYTLKDEIVAEQVSRGRLNRMCKYFKNKEVHMQFDYRNSLGNFWTHKIDTVYDDFKIHEIEVSGCPEFTVSFIYKGKEVFLQEFPGNSDAEFLGLGVIQWINDGPYCYFSIKQN